MSSSVAPAPRWRAALAVTAAGATVAATLLTTGGTGSAPPLPFHAREWLRPAQGIDQAGGAGGETDEIKAALGQFNDARNAPGFAQAGGYTAAVDHINGMPTSGGTWTPVTNVPYNSDDPHFRDYYSNSGAGSGYVTGRVQTLAASDRYLFAGGAVGGVYRTAVDGNGTDWTLVSQGVPALSSGALVYVPKARELWYATGDGSTGSTTYTGDGVWVATDPDGTPSWTHLADGTGHPNLFDGAVINQLRFSPDGAWVYAASSFGVWRHSTSDLTAEWQPVFVPHPDSLPGGSTAGPGAYADNYVTDVAVDPADPGHVVVAYGWVAGGAANGWYDGRYSDGAWTFTRSNVAGAITTTDIGRTTFAWAGNGTLYALVQNPDHAATGVSYSELEGVFRSRAGISGPWAKIADSQKLSQSGSALDPTVNGAGAVFAGYQPGVQAWYNQFLAVDPANADHVIVGLEEVYETTNAGAGWRTIGPYWNFFFSCWGSDVPAPQVGCPTTTHADQHAVTIAGNRLFVGNDGGVYARPLDGGTVDRAGHATDWVSLTAKGTPDFLQYYAVGVGAWNPAKADATTVGDHTGYVISGGMQDNGGSIKFSDTQGMSSNFGGDGGDVLVDPNDGCRIVQEYVELSMSVTNTCAATDPTSLAAWSSTSAAHTRDIRPPETHAQFIAPFAADHRDINTWVAAGQHVWLNTKGFNIGSGSDWLQLADLGTSAAGSPHMATAVAADGHDAIVGYCGSCKPGAYEGGIAFGTAEPGATWTRVSLGDAGLPDRWVGGADVYHDSTGQVHYLLAFNGFSRRWTEGPGAGVGHVFTSTDGVHWTDISGNLPDVPMSTVKWVGDGRIVVGSDLGAFLLDQGTWYRLGTGLPATVVTDLEPGPDGNLYAATYGRGIWSLPVSGLPSYAGGSACQDAYIGQDVPADCDPYVPMTSSTGTKGAGKGRR